MTPIPCPRQDPAPPGWPVVAASVALAAFLLGRDAPSPAERPAPEMGPAAIPASSEATGRCAGPRIDLGDPGPTDAALRPGSGTPRAVAARGLWPDAPPDRVGPMPRRHEPASGFAATNVPSSHPGRVALHLLHCVWLT